MLRRSLDFVGRLKFYKPSLSDSPPTLPLKGRRWGIFQCSPTKPPLGRKKWWYISQTWTIYITLLWILLRFSFALSLYNRSGTEKSFYVSPITREISGTFRSCLLSWKYMQGLSEHEAPILLADRASTSPLLTIAHLRCAR